MLVDAWGVQSQYADAAGQQRQIPQSTIDALRQSLGTDGEPLPPESRVRVVYPGKRIRWPTRGRLLLEDGSALTVEKQLPADLPFGYHHFDDGKSDRLLFVIASPRKCVIPQKQLWGWSVQLYAARSKTSWGIGDLDNLATLGRWSRTQGSSILLVNPLCASTPGTPVERSPYSPSSRRFRNLIYLHIEHIPGGRDLGELSNAMAGEAAKLNQVPLVEWDRILALKSRALSLLWERFQSDLKFDAYCREQGQSLQEYAAYCVLAEEFGADFRGWPAQYRLPSSGAVQAFIAARAERLRFHQWVQWQLDQQLARAAGEVPLMQDLPIGIDPGGADAWIWQDVLAMNVAVGAPPDLHNTRGQNWGLPPWIPHRLQAAEYQPFIQTIRAMLRHAGGLRIDHALGLFRLFWIPDGVSPADGGFVRYPHEELLAILALESHRAGAFIVGEDLGTTEALVQRELAKHAILSYRLLWFEKRSPSSYPRLSLAAVTTHDLPTVAGLWTGSDLADQQDCGTHPNVKATNAILGRVRRMGDIAADAPLETVVRQMYDLLGSSESLIRIATLEDAMLVQKRPNLPGAHRDWPNWSRPLPHPIENLDLLELPREIANSLAGKSVRAPSAKGVS
jgi:4-alpha-glucanotransferase